VLVFDVLLSLYSLRFFAIIVGFAVALALWRQWWLLTLYGLVVTGAIVPYFRTDDEEARESIEAHTRLRKRLVPPLKWVLRIGVAVVAFFLLESILSFAQIKAAISAIGQAYRQVLEIRLRVGS